MTDQTPTYVIEFKVPTSAGIQVRQRSIQAWNRAQARAELHFRVEDAHILGVRGPFEHVG